MPKVTAKHRAKRIDPAFPIRRDSIRFRRWVWTGAASGCVLVYCLWCLLGGTQSKQQFTHGPVVQSHALIENQCDKCHEPFVPVRADAWAVSLFRENTSSKSWGKIVEQKCLACHATPSHHWETQLDRDHLSCTVCHQEHHGREAVITRAADHICMKCHDRLNEHISSSDRRLKAAVASAKTSSSPIADHVGRFDRDHPEFRSLAVDKGTLKGFSHKLHLSPGIQSDGSSTSKWPPLTWNEMKLRRNEIESSIPERSSSAPPADLVQLECRHCHEMESSLRPADRSSFSKSDDLLPINFNRHCAVCHEKDLPARIPHGASQEEIAHQLEQQFWKSRTSTELVATQIPLRPLPGQENNPELVALKEALSIAVSDGQREAAERCGHCHKWQDAKSFVVTKPVIASTWFEHARFNHAAHQGINCADCHVGVEQSTKSTDMLIEGRATCLKCHTSQPQETQSGSARFDCAECHQYHVDSSSKHLGTHQDPLP